MRVKLFLFIFCASLFYVLNGKVYADLINPDFYTKKCNPGEIEVSCSYRSKEPFGPHTYDECSLYRNNPNYRFLVGQGSSFGGSSKFCFKALNTGQFLNSIIDRTSPQLIGTLLIELFIFYLFGFRAKRALFFIALVNIFTVLVFTLVGLSFQMNFLSIILAELIIIFFEMTAISKLTQIPLRLVVIPVLSANVVSMTLGSWVLHFIFRLF